MAIKKTNDPDLDEFLDEDEPKDTLVDAVPKRYEILNNFWDRVEKNLPKNTNTLMRFIAHYRDINLKVLDTPYPIDYPVWTETNKRAVCDAIGVDEKELRPIVMGIEGVGGYKDPYLSDKAYIFAMFLAYRYYLLTGQEKYATMMEYYIGYRYYTMAFTNSFKRFKPKPEIMMYTINNMTYKSKIKKFASVHKLIYYLTDSTMITYKERLVRGSDYEILYVIDKMRDKYNNIFKDIYRKHAESIKNKEYIFTSVDFDDEGKQRPNSSMTGEIITLADRYTTRFFESPISEICIKYARNKDSKSGTIPERDLRNTIAKIAGDTENQEDVRTFYQSVFYLFFSGEKKYTAKDVNTPEFIVEMQRVYRPGNSIDKNKIIIRDIMDKWLKIGSATYKSTNRTATISIFRKSIFDYFIFKTATDK